MAPKGVMVGQVSAGSAAAAAGLAEGNIITKAAGFSLFSALHLKALMAQVASGKTIELTLKSAKSVKMTPISD